MNITVDTTVPTQGEGIYDHLSGTVFDVTSVYLGLLTVFGILNNGTVLVLYTRYKTLQNPINLFLITISIGDLSVSVLGSPFTFAANVARRWLFGADGCTWYAFIVTVCGVEQIVSLATVSIHRCCLVVRPLTARKMNKRWALIFIAMTWIYSLIVSLPPALGWNSYTLEGTGTACSVDWMSYNPGDSSYIIFIFIMVLVIPLSLIVGSYTLLIYAVKKSSSSEAARSSQYKAEKKVTILVVVMITSFLVAWTPYAAFSLYVTASKNNSISPVAASVPAMFAKSCTVYNPIIYFLLNKQFKDALFDMICCGRNLLRHDNEADHAGTARAGLRAEAPAPIPISREATRAPIMCGRRQEFSDTQTSEIGATPAIPRRHVKRADWSDNEGATSSLHQDQPTKPIMNELEAGTQTPVEVFQIDEGESDEKALITETVKKHSKCSFKGVKICPFEQPDVEEV